MHKKAHLCCGSTSFWCDSCDADDFDTSFQRKDVSTRSSHLAVTRWWVWWQLFCLVTAHGTANNAQKQQRREACIEFSVYFLSYFSAKLNISVETKSNYNMHLCIFTTTWPIEFSFNQCQTKKRYQNKSVVDRNQPKTLPKSILRDITLWNILLCYPCLLRFSINATQLAYYAINTSKPADKIKKN